MTLLDVLKEYHMEEMNSAFAEDFINLEFTPIANDLSLDEASVEQYARFCSLDDETILKMKTAAKKAAEDPDLELLTKMIFRIIFLSEPAWCPAWAWQPLDKLMGELAGPLYLVIASGFVPLMKKCHAVHNVPEDVTRATCYQIRAYCNNYFNGTGKCGIYPNQLSWLHIYVRPEHLLVRLGRFEFRQVENYNAWHAYRNKTTGEMVVLASPGFHFDKKGFALSRDAIEPECEFTTVYAEDAAAGTITGNRVDAFGCTAKEPVTLPLKEYELAVGPGMDVLEMHIPSGGGMTPQESERSFKMAKEFFSNRPKKPVAIVCASWIFNPNLPDILPPDSNLVRLLKRVHPVPCPSTPTDGLWFIFLHEGAFELLKAPQKTSLQKAVTKFIGNGGRWRVGGMFLPMDEI